MLRLPHGLEIVGARWFRYCSIEKVLISNTVRELGDSTFCFCRNLREVVFELGSQLETIGDYCFSGCDLQEITIPKSVRSIENFAFQYCHNLQSLTFEEGSRLAHVGKNIVSGTMLDLDEVEFPSTAQIDYEEEEEFTGASVRDYTDSDES